MNEVYNLMDVFFLSTSGEGFCIPIIEAMGCGIPQVVTNYTTTYELLQEEIQTGLPVNLVGTLEKDNPIVHCNEIIAGTLTGTWNVERGIMSINHAVECLNRLYYEEQLRKILSENSIIKAKKYYTWDKVIEKWEKVLMNLINSQ